MLPGEVLGGDLHVVPHEIITQRLVSRESRSLLLKLEQCVV